MMLVHVYFLLNSTLFNSFDTVLIKLNMKGMTRNMNESKSYEMLCLYVIFDKKRKEKQIPPTPIFGILQNGTPLVKYSIIFTRINQIVKGWINYFRIGKMKTFIDEFGQWLRHKIRVIILKQWKKPLRIYKNLQKLNKKLPYHFSDEQIYSVANTRLGWYKRANGNVVNFLLNADILAIRKGERPGLVNPLKYYLG